MSLTFFHEILYAQLYFVKNNKMNTKSLKKIKRVLKTLMEILVE